MSKLRWIAIFASLGATLGYQLERRTSLFQADAAMRGRKAKSPWQIPWLGWQDVFVRTWNETLDDRLMSLAASVAFFALLAMVPGLSVLISIYGLVADVTLQPQQLASYIELLPDSARPLILDQAERLASQSSDKLSWNILFSLAIAGWSANAATKGLFDGLNVVYDEVEKRSFVKLNAITLLSTIGGIFVLVVALSLTAIAPAIIRSLPFGDAAATSAVLLRWPIFYALATGAIALLYWIGPSRRQPRFVWVLPGALVAALAWGLISAGFSIYVAKFANYSAMYGSLATVIIFMTWLWLSACVVLVGAELNAELEHQTAEDTTIGLPQKAGSRGAVVADHVGSPVVRGRR